MEQEERNEKHKLTKEFWNGGLGSQKEKLSIQESFACLLFASGQDAGIKKLLWTFSVQIINSHLNQGRLCQALSLGYGRLCHSNGAEALRSLT